MKILSFDTSTKYLSIACLDDDVIKSELHEEMGIRHSEMLLTKFQEVLDFTNWTIKDIDLVCVGIGPGSFTGLRIAVATCKGFAAAIGTKVLGVPSVDAIALNASLDEGFVAPVLDARKGKIYSTIYEKKGHTIKRVSEYLLLTAAEFVDRLDKKIYIFGDGVNSYEDILSKSDLIDIGDLKEGYPKAADIGILGYNRFKEKNSADDPETLDPMYLHARDCNVTIKKKKTG